MFSTTKTLTKTLMMTAALTLAAGCDAEPEAADLLGDEDVTFRPVGGFKLNTSFIGGFEFSEFDRNYGVPHDGIVLIKVCASYKGDPMCLDEVWVENGELVGRKNALIFKQWDFLNSTWSYKIDADRDGSFDSSIDTKIIAMSEKFTSGGDQYLSYSFAYDTTTASGLITKKLEPSKKPVPMCEVDPDTGSIGSIVIRDLSIDLKSGDMKDRKDTIQIACDSSAVGKVPYFGFLPHVVGTKVVETIVRMIRADYCGDGTSFTEPGQKLQLEDVWGANAFFDPAGKDEAFWVVGAGAVCLGVPRHAGVTYEDVRNHCGIEECKDGASMADYGADLHTKLVP